MLSLKSQLERTKLVKRLRAAIADVERYGAGVKGAEEDLEALRAGVRDLVAAKTEGELSGVIRWGVLRLAK